MARVRIPSPLRSLTGGTATLEVPGATLRGVLTSLAREHPGLGPRLLDERGELPRHVNVFVGERDVRTLAGLDTPVADGDTVAIVPAVAGGATGHPARATVRPAGGGARGRPATGPAGRGPGRC